MGNEQAVNKRSGLCGEEMMTLKEVANILNVSTDTIYNIAKRLFSPSDLNRRVVNGGNAIVLTESQVTKVKLDLQTNKRISNTTNEVQTDLEVIATAGKALSDLLDLYKRKEAEYKAIIGVQKQQLIEQQPKVEMYDDLVDRKYLKNFRDFAQMQGISQTKLMDFLRSKYIYKNVGGEYRAYAEYSDMFELRAFQKGKDKIGNQLLLNLKGIQYFGNLLASTLGK